MSDMYEMPEPFGDLLAAVVRSAADAAGVPGAAEARRRGRQRRTRRRLATTALVLALIGGLGGVAAGALGQSSSSTPPQVGPGGAPSVSATAPPSPTHSASPSAMATTPAPPPSTSPPSTPSTPTTTILNPSTFVSGGWITKGNLPYAHQVSWVAGTDLYGTVVGTAGGGSVYVILNSPVNHVSYALGLGNLCQMTSMGVGTSGVQVEDFSGDQNGGYLVNTQASWLFAMQTSQAAFFYTGSAAATTAWDGLGSDFSTCAADETGVDPSTGTQRIGSVQRTLQQSDAQCWTNREIPAGSSSGGAQFLVVGCFVRSGAMIAVDLVEFDQLVPGGGFSAVNTSAYDDASVHALRNSLGAYTTSGS
ncbi:MAG TPA: hypothetical protein VGX23_07455 [Actinocrinis sp.]|nr:hypothetical protein [Actinocrinis sp.]